MSTLTIQVSFNVQFDCMWRNQEALISYKAIKTSSLILSQIYTATCHDGLRSVNDDHDPFYDLKPPVIMMFTESTRNKHLQIMRSVTPYSKSCKNLTKKSEKMESRNSCSAPLLISGTCATRITFNSILALFYNFFSF